MAITAPVPRVNRSTVLHRLRAAVALPVICLVLAACGAGFQAQTNQQYQDAEGISYRGGDVYVLNALVVSRGQNGTLVGTLINQSAQPDGLVSVTTVDAQSRPIQTTKLNTPIALASQAAVKLETDGAVRLNGRGVAAGDIITVTFTFRNASPVELDIPIVPDGPIYTGIPVGKGLKAL